MAATALLLVLTASPATAQSAQLAVIVGLAGDPEFGELYS
jgi:hypothetical protein